MRIGQCGRSWSEMKQNKTYQHHQGGFTAYTVLRFTIYTVYYSRWDESHHIFKFNERIFI